MEYLELCTDDHVEKLWSTLVPSTEYVRRERETRRERNLCITWKMALTTLSIVKSVAVGSSDIKTMHTLQEFASNKTLLKRKSKTLTYTRVAQKVVHLIFFLVNIYS